MRADPSLLARAPRRWKRRPEVVAALGAALALQTGGCSDSDAGKGRARVAPVFWQGDGKAPTGKPAPYTVGFAGDYAFFVRPEQLPEDEGVQFVVDELAQCGVLVSRSSDVVKNVNLIGVRPAAAHDWTADEPGTVWVDRTTPFIPDLRSADSKLMIEYVSGEDVSSLGYQGPWEGDWDEGQSYRVARGVARDMQRLGDGVVAGVLCSPAPTIEELGLVQRDGEEYGEWGERCDAVLQAEARRRLREQVKSFVEWLKGQGVI